MRAKEIKSCSSHNEVGVSDLATEIREDLLNHFAKIGLDRNHDGPLSKNQVRLILRSHRRQTAKQETALVRDRGEDLLSQFACGSEVDPTSIEPELVFIDNPASPEGYLFRFATLLWSVPVSRGFGRRMRFIIRDRSNQKLIGILALGSPVFNLNARDEWIGWASEDRKERLVNVMDAYVLGAVPPYSRLLGGKLIGALAGSSEIQERFNERYGHRCSVNGNVTDAQFVLMTTTSGLGRSSVYNRLRLKGIIDYQRIGWTKGWGHFHIPESIFCRMRDLLSQLNHEYASGYSFGDGPNWRIRVIRVALEEVGLDPALLRHGVKREVFGVPLTKGWRKYLNGEREQVEIHRPSAQEITEAAKLRWIVPRALRCPDYQQWTRDDTWSIVKRRLEFTDYTAPAENESVHIREGQERFTIAWSTRRKAA